jgi:hypothetical protein
MELYHKQREEVTVALRASPFRINWNLDLWTSPNNMSILGIVAHWMDENFQKRNTLMGMREMEAAHSGAMFWKLLKELGLEHCAKLGYSMLDNATSNTTAVTTLEHRLELEQPNPGDPMSCFSAAERRLHCFGHILNLVVRRTYSPCMAPALIFKSPMTRRPPKKRY